MYRPEHELKVRLTKLQEAYNQTKEAMLGTDWETRTELKLLSERIIEEMRVTINKIQSLNRVSV